jgi:hypothetical protein
VSRFTRGMRRLAIPAGVIGLAVGSAVAYLQFAELVRIRAAADRFQALMALAGVVGFSLFGRERLRYGAGTARRAIRAAQHS